MDALAELPFGFGLRSGQVVTANAEFEMSGGLATNDPSTFGWDAADPAGLIIRRSGIYVFMAAIRTSQPSAAKRILIKHGLLSSGPFPGGDTGSTDFYLGDGQSQASLAEVTATNTISKSVLNAIAAQSLQVAPLEGPYRVAVLLVHMGTNYTLDFSSFRGIRIGNFPTRSYEPAPAQPEGVDTPAQGVSFAFDDPTHGMAQTWTRLDDPDA